MFLKIKKFIKLFCLLVLLLVLSDMLFVVFFPKQHLPKEKASFVVVLGAAPNSPAIKNRTMEGLRVLQEGKGEKLVLSGGKTNKLDESEAQNMARVVKSTSTGVVPILEGNSANTWENLHNTKNLLSASEFSVLLVTDTYHLARSWMTARFAGFNEVFWASPDNSYYSKKDLRYYYFREVVAVPWYLWRWFSGEFDKN